MQLVMQIDFSKKQPIEKLHYDPFSDHVYSKNKSV